MRSATIALELLRVGARGAEQPRVLQRDRRLARQRRGELLLLRGEVVDVRAQHGEGADRAVADEQRRGQHGAEPAPRGDLRIPDAGRVVLDVLALQRAALLHGEAGHALAHPDADPPARLGLEVEAGRRRQLAGRGIQREHAARLHAEHLARLLEDHPDGLAGVEALAHRPPRLEQRLGLPRPALALLEQPRVLDRDPGLVGEGLEQRLVAALKKPGRAEKAERRRSIRRRRGAAPQQRADALLLVHVAERRARIGRMSATRIGTPSGAPRGR